MALRAGYYGVKRVLKDKLAEIAGAWDQVKNEVVEVLPDGIIANTKLIKDTVGWSGKNILENLLESHTTNGVTMTRNADGSITLNNTATAWTFQNINFKGSDVVSIPTGDYIISGGNSKVTFKIMVNGTSIFAKKVTQDEPFTIPANVTSSYMRIEFDGGTVFNNDTIYPMIRKAGILDNIYEPYFGSTVETILADHKTTINAIITAATSAADFAAFKTAMGAITTVTRSSYIEGTTEPDSKAIAKEPVVEKKTTTSKKSTAKSDTTKEV